MSQRGSAPRAPAARSWRGLMVAAVLLVVAGWRLVPTAAPDERVIDFQQYRFGVTPAEFEFEATGPHGPVLTAGRPMWRAYVDRFAPSPASVLIQASALARADHYPIALLRDLSASDLSLSVWFKPMGGTLSQSAGMVWRAMDRDNYYAVLADAREDRVRLLRIVDGRVQEIGSAESAVDVEFERRDGPSVAHGWHTLAVEATGDRIRVWAGGKLALSAEDGTFRRPGRVGLLTHADSVALFDDLRIQIGGRGFTPPTRRRSPRPPAPVMHVAEVAPTDATFRSPQQAFTGTVYWRVRVVDDQDRPVAGARIHAELAAPDGTARTKRSLIAGTDGRALFMATLAADEPEGTYTARVIGLSHADRADATHDRSADLASSARFLARPAPPPILRVSSECATVPPARAAWRKERRPCEQLAVDP
jgi:hypothetical protein